MARFSLYGPGSPEYVAAYELVLRSSDDSAHLEEFLTRQLVGGEKLHLAIDWGAGSGRVTEILLRHVPRVLAVEPSEEMRALLRVRCPAATIVPGTIMRAADVPTSTRADFSTMIHVLYHVPDDEWRAHVLRAAAYLRPGGRLAVVLKHRESGCNRMIEHFGARRFDLFPLAARLESEGDYGISLRQLPGGVRTASFDDTVQIAKFMLCDRGRDGYARLPETEDEFEAYVRAHFWDEGQGVGGWSCPQVCLLLRA